MKKQLMIIGIIVILLTVGLSGCNENIPEKIEYNISESLIFENIKYTFLSAYWTDSIYKLKIKAENIDNKNRQSSNVLITQYKMQNGYTYNPAREYGITFITFDLALFENDTKILIDYSSIDKDFLPVAKIYLQLFSPGGQWTYSNNTKPIEINVI